MIIIVFRTIFHAKMTDLEMCGRKNNVARLSRIYKEETCFLQPPILIHS